MVGSSDRSFCAIIVTHSGNALTLTMHGHMAQYHISKMCRLLMIFLGPRPCLSSSDHRNAFPCSVFFFSLASCVMSSGRTH